MTRRTSEAGSQGPGDGDDKGEEGVLAVAMTVGDGPDEALDVVAGLGVGCVTHEPATAPTRSAARIEILARGGEPTVSAGLMHGSGYPAPDDPSLARSSGPRVTGPSGRRSRGGRTPAAFVRTMCARGGAIPHPEPEAPMSATLIPELHEAQEAVAGLSLRTRQFIGGRFRDALSGRRYVTENPATGQPIAEIAEGGSADVDAAVAAARSAAESGVWSRMNPGDRKAILIRWANLIEAHSPELGLIETIDAGKPISDTIGLDMPESAACIRWHAEAADKLYGQVAPSPDGTVATITREPVGVVGAVIPWNYPAQMAAWKLGPALATGNSVVIKPASTTSLSLLRIAELGAEAGIPDGVLNVVTGPGDTVGEAIGRHPDIDCVAFTGSTEVGRRFLRYSAETNLKRVLLELGGKSPQIVFGDAADLTSVAANVATAIFWNMGENCSAGSRLIVHRSIKADLLEAVAAELANWPVGDPLDPATKIGALISRGHLERVLDYIRIGRSEGARVVAGGSRILEETGGYFVPPTIFDDVRNDMRIAREEIFGPVLSVIEFETEAEAVALANDTPYGLAASLYTENLNVAHRVARELKAGVVGVNAYSEGDMTTPFGGYKLSGFGGHDKSIHAHDQYTETKTIWIQLRPAG
ncbi:MAG TPA: aldehyde dehydrogenase [Candidatus Sulfomarinibacteraceae bacterium]|nr:aldehyde dehydrogenase [Candidatus Sulfomarinibacteraceae bacterium]